MGCDNFRVGRTKRGDVRLEIQEPIRGVWIGHVLDEQTASAMADALREAVTPTAADMTRDDRMEP